MYKNNFFSKDRELNNEGFFNPDMIKAIVISFIIGVFFCFLTTGHYVIYLSCLGTIFIAIICCYWRTVNYRNFIKFLLVILFNISGYFLVCYQVGFKDTVYDVDELRYVFCGMILIVLGLIAMFLPFSEHSVKVDKKLEELFMERKGDLQRIERMVEAFPVVCVDAAMGQGKSFLMDHFRNNNKDKYVFIRVKPLTYGVERIAQYVVNELFSVLEQNGIFTFKFYLKNALVAKNEQIGLISTFFSDCNDTSYDFFEQVCREFEKIDKKVIIDFEDIDRITEFATLADIFSIAETISELTSRIKIVFEGNMLSVKNMVDGHYQNNWTNLEVDHADKYLEKYLSRNVHLTDISLEKAMRNFVKLREGDVEK